MSSSPPVADAGRKSGRTAFIAGLVLLAAAAGAFWWWSQSRLSSASAEQQARLDAALERGKALSSELASIKPPAPPDCPPGQSVKTIAPGAVLPSASSPSLPAVSPNASAPVTSGERAAVLPDYALAQRLEQVTALVLVDKGQGTGMGTGFFIGPNLLVTNRHVVEGSTSGRIVLVSKALGAPRPATLLKTTQSSDPGSPDFALLRMDQGTAPGVLDLSPDLNKLSAVVAAGYPAVVTENDASFRRLMQGDLSAAPDLNMTQGAVQSLQSGAGGMPLIVHTASIAKGNSGGPLVDACGRLVGINTFISVDQTQSSKINYAIRAQVMATFLQAAGTTVRADTRLCGARG